MKKLLDLRSENDVDLHIIDVNKRSKVIILDVQEYIYYNLLEESENDFIEMLKNNDYDDLEDMVYRLEIRKNEIIDKLDLKHIPLSTISYTFLNGIYQIRDNDFILQSLLPNDVELKNSIDDIRLISKLSTYKTTKFT